MKNAMLLGATFCALLLATPALGQRKPRLRGSRQVVSVEKPLPSFTHLVLEDDLEVRIKPGPSETVRIDADDNLVDILRFDLDGDTLRIAAFYKIISKKQLDLTLSYTHLHSIKVIAGNLEGTAPSDTEQMDLHIGEGGRAQLEAGGGLVTVILDGNATADLRLTADSVSFRASDQADVRMYSGNGALSVALTGAASLLLEGSSPALKADLSGNTRLDAQGLEVQEAAITLEASSHGRIRATERLVYEGSGDSRLFVYGQPRIEILGFRDKAVLRKVPD